MDDNTAGERTEILSRTQTAYAKYLKNRVQLGSWLDVGADIGLVSEALLQEGVASRVDAIEPNVQVHSELQCRLGEGGHVYWTTENLAEKYKGVVAIHVFDHLYNPLSEGRTLSKHLEDGGVLSVVVHNERSLLRFLLGPKWPPFCLQHPQVYSPRSLRFALLQVGFEVESIRRTTNWFTANHIASVFASVVGFSDIGVSTFGQISFPIKLGNIQVVARRR